MTQLILKCESCGFDVAIASQERFLDLLSENRLPLCEQCRRYVSPGTARVPEVSDSASLTQLGLVDDIGSSTGKRKPLASLRLGRCGRMG